MPDLLLFSRDRSLMGMLGYSPGTYIHLIKTAPMRTSDRKPSFWPWLSRLFMLGCMSGPVTKSVSAQPGESLYTIPVVFHVLHQSGPENIADAQIDDALSILNAHFDAPTGTIDPPFDVVAGDMDIAFELASTAPDGSPTTGIDRVETPLTDLAGDDNSYLNPWPRNRYLNIWVVNSFASEFIATISRNPASADAQPCIDGIMILSSYVGSIGTGAIYRTVPLTQAVGRFFNLKMLYEDPINGGPCGDDEVADTPPCVPATCIGAPNTCSDLPVNDRNFMHSPYASNMFTLGQRERVHACLSSPVAQRNELASGTATWTPACATTGLSTLDGSTSEIIISPVPFHDRLTINGPDLAPYRIEIQDMSGRLITAITSLSPGKAIEMDVDLPPGPYILVLNRQGSRVSRLIVKD